MGRRPRDYDPDGLENSRERQKRRQIAPLRREAPTAPEEDPTSTALQPSRSSRIDMAASVPNSTHYATSVPQTGPSSNANTNSGGLYTTIGREHDETLTEALVKIVPGSKKVGIIEDCARRHDLLLIRRLENKRRSIVEGPQPTDRLRTDYTTQVTIRHPSSSDPNEASHMTADVWTPVPHRQLPYDVRLPSNQRATFCKPVNKEEQTPEQLVDEEDQPHTQPVVVRGHLFMDVNGDQDFLALLKHREHDDISKGGFCRLCFDMALLKEIIWPN